MALLVLQDHTDDLHDRQQGACTVCLPANMVTYHGLLASAASYMPYLRKHAPNREMNVIGVISSIRKNGVHSCWGLKPQVWGLAPRP